MQIFRTWEKYKGNSFKNGRLLVCSGRRKLLEHWARAVTIRVRCPIVRKEVFVLGNYIGSIQPAPKKFIIFSLVRKTMSNAELPVWCIVMAATFGQQNGASVYFVDRIKRNLRRSQLVCTKSEVRIFLKIRGTVGDITTIKHLRFNLMSVMQFMLTFSSREVSVQHRHCKPEAQQPCSVSNTPPQ